jgi:hypothetical protein
MPSREVFVRLLAPPVVDELAEVQRVELSGGAATGPAGVLTLCALSMQAAVHGLMRGAAVATATATGASVRITVVTRLRIRFMWFTSSG